ncbi:MAG: hypothetical protein EU548_05690 [Promethearchaeota archaeon]|nr:MAG: hypothetical protein EU548_05690 [Candidatus Lokiarchaeota archaeon]
MICSLSFDWFFNWFSIIFWVIFAIILIFFIIVIVVIFKLLRSNVNTTRKKAPGFRNPYAKDFDSKDDTQQKEKKIVEEEIEKDLRCQFCNQIVQEDEIFCPFCGERIKE